MQVEQTEIPGLLILTPRRFGDSRGFFSESWNKRQMADHGLHYDFVQDNHSLSKQGTLRGLHYQIKQPQGKLVRATRGSVVDDAGDMRRSSPTEGQWSSCVLSAEKKNLFWVPPGFAHGFYVLSEEAEFQYKCTDLYAPEHERTLIWNDPDIGIDWPLAEQQAPLLSVKDKQGATLHNADCYS